MRLLLRIWCPMVLHYSQCTRLKPSAKACLCHSAARVATLESRLGDARSGLGDRAPSVPPLPEGASLLARVEALEAALDTVMAAQVTQQNTHQAINCLRGLSYSLARGGARHSTGP